MASLRCLRGKFAYTNAEIGTMALAIFFLPTLPAGTCMLAQVQIRKLNLAKHKKEWKCHIILDFYHTHVQHKSVHNVRLRNIENVHIGTGSKQTGPPLCTTRS
jgi:hypothetical protein